MFLKALRKRIKRLIKAARNRSVSSEAVPCAAFSRTSEIRNGQGESAADVDLVKNAVERGNYSVIEDNPDFLILEISTGDILALACLKPKADQKSIFLVLSVHSVDIAGRDAIIRSLRAFWASARSFSKAGAG